MKIPERGQTETYFISDNKVAAVKLEAETGKFWVTVVNSEYIDLPAESPFAPNSNVAFLDTFQDVKKYLFEKADENYKEQFTK